MKTVELLIDDELELMGIQAVSLVEFPAIETNFVYFGKDRYVLAKLDDEKRMLIGPALIPDKMIPRISEETGEEYEVFFSPETIRQASEKYMRDENTNAHTYEHESEIDNLTVVESWIIADEDKDKASLYGFKLPVGTWMLAVKVNNEEVWNRVKDGDVRGFSIEGYFVDQVVEASAVELRKPCESCPDDPEVLLELKNLVLEEMSPVMILDDRPLFATQEEAELFGELFLNCVGSHSHIIDNEKLYMPCATHPEKLAKALIKKDKRAKKGQRIVMESYNDYPQSVANNAKRGIELNERNNNKCATQTGKVRAQQLANKEPISIETIRRMKSFLSRHEENYDPNATTTCGTISFLLWGGLSALRWATSKLEELES